MEEKKKSNKILFIIIGIVLVVIIALVVFLLMNNKDKKKTNTPSSSNPSVNDSNSNKNDDNTQYTLSNESEELMKLIPNKDDVAFDVEGFDLKVVPGLYLGKTLKGKDVNMESLMYITAINIPLSEKYNGSVECSDGTSTLDLDTVDKDICYKKVQDGNVESDAFAIPEEVMKTYFKKYYGDEVPYKIVNNFGEMCSEYKYQNGYYFTEGGGCGGVYLKQKNYDTRFLKEETTDSEKYIYLSFIYYVTDVKGEEEITATLYKDSELKEKIAENVANSDDMFEVAGDKAAVYKHTYKKNADGSYYWYSVEQVK